MKERNIIFKTIFCTLILSFASSFLFAQVPDAEEPENLKTDFTMEQIVKYVKIIEEAGPIQKDARQEAVNIIESHGMDLLSFNAVLAVEQGASNAEISEERMKAFHQASQEILELNEEVQRKLLDIVKKHELDPTIYKQMVTAYDKDLDFRAKVDAVILERKH